MQKEVRATLHKLYNILIVIIIYKIEIIDNYFINNKSFLCLICNFKDCSRLFPITTLGNNGAKRTEKYLLTGAQDQIKCNLTLTGDSITQAV